jgi:osmotically-inducible protein OsmY
MSRFKLAVICLAASIPFLYGCVPVVVAGAGGAVMMSEDRRTAGTIVDDQTIEGRARSRIEDKYDDRVHVDLASYNRFILLVGEVPDQQTKDDIGAVALGVENVRNVQNELIIGPNTSGSTRANDAYLTSKVKARFVSENKFKANHVKVITENRTVYLLGLVKREEGDAAADIASTTAGVQKVIKVFEYILNLTRAGERRAQSPPLAAAYISSARLRACA